MNAAILADLQGPKLRVGNVEEGAVVNPGDTVTFTNTKCEGTKERVYMTYQAFPKDVNPGETILLDDGKLMMRVISTNRKDEVVTEVVQGGLEVQKRRELAQHACFPTHFDGKGLGRPRSGYGRRCGLDWIELCCNAQDIKKLRAILNKNKNNAGIIAKIEKPEAVSDIERILDETVASVNTDLGSKCP